VSTYEGQSNGTLKQDARKLPAPPQFFRGSQGLYSTAGDYTRFMQMILRNGRGGGYQQILRPDTVRMMATNQIGKLSAGKMKLIGAGRPPEAHFHPGFVDGFGLGFLINATAYEGGRSAGSLAWAGGYNTFYWIDPQRKLCAVLLMQFHPFFDPQAIAMLNDFEHAVSTTLEHSAVPEHRRSSFAGHLLGSPVHAISEEHGAAQAMIDEPLPGSGIELELQPPSSVAGFDLLASVSISETQRSLGREYAGRGYHQFPRPCSVPRVGGRRQFACSGALHAGECRQDSPPFQYLRPYYLYWRSRGPANCLSPKWMVRSSSMPARREITELPTSSAERGHGGESGPGSAQAK
jgi:Beta-lactamase